MNLENLERYLNNHVAGAKAALDLIEALAERSGEEGERQFFLDLHSEIASDFDIVISLLEEPDFRERSPVAAAAKVTGFASRMKLMWDGWDRGDLGLLESYELLVMGITGKRLLWSALEQVKEFLPPLALFDFVILQERAMEQATLVEQRRQLEVRGTFIQDERISTAQ